MRSYDDWLTTEPDPLDDDRPEPGQDWPDVPDDLPEWWDSSHVFEPDPDAPYGLYCAICGASETDHHR